MPDMLVRLYDLPDSKPLAAGLEAGGVRCRRAESFEKSAVVRFVASRWPAWEDEAIAAFGKVPPTMIVAIEGEHVVGFAAYNATRPDYFGPAGVDEGHRGRGIGTLLLLRALEALAAEGYAYAIIGGVGPAAFYEKTVGAVPIPGSEPGIYGGRTR
ncbi:MAG: GNAT family N-acetyltransferase [Dehalococcoidia bacterium]